MIELKNVTKEYSKGHAALNGVSVKIEVYIDSSDHERVGSDRGDDHREWTEPESNETP